MSEIKPTDGEPVVISSYVLEVVPEYVQDVVGAMTATDGVEVHETHESKIVATIEAPTIKDSHTIASGFANYVGVLGVNLVYANFEDETNPPLS